MSHISLCLVQAFGDYAERMRKIEEKKVTKLSAAEKRHQFQQDSLKAEFQAKIQAIMDESLVRTLDTLDNCLSLL